MYIYRGKLNFLPSDSQNATNEAITIMFPSNFLLGDPVYTCWQWSALGRSKNVPCWINSTIDSVADSDTDGNKIGFYGGSDYRFDGFLSGPKGIEELLLVVRSGNVVGTATNTKLVIKPDSGSSIDRGFIEPRIYLGRLANYAPYSTDQLLLVVIPGRTIAEGNAICAFWQWTVNAAGLKKVNVDFTPSKMTNVENVADSVSFRFTNGHYTFRAIVSSKDTGEQQQLTLTMTNPSNVSTGTLTLELPDLRLSPSGRKPRGVNDSTTVVINDTNKIAGGSQNEGLFLTRSLVEMGPKIVELTNRLDEKLNGLEQAVRDRDGIIAQLESKLRAARDQNELLNKKLLATEAREWDRLTAQGTQDQRESEMELSDDEDNLNQPAFHDDKEDDFNNNQPT